VAPPPEIPHEYKCPVALTIMKDPVLVVGCPQGHTVERAEALKWLVEKPHSTCPHCADPLTNGDKHLVPNLSLRILIQDFKERYGLDDVGNVIRA
jgi:hypothetical protein